MLRRLEVTNCYVDASSFGGSIGAGIFAGPGVTLSLFNTTISHSTAYGGRGGCVFISGGASLHSKGSNFTGCSVAPEGEGAGLYLEASSTANLEASCSCSNRGAIRGGGIWVGNYVVLRMVQSRVKRNYASGHGAGFYVGQATTIGLHGCFIGHNWGCRYGGGFYSVAKGSLTAPVFTFSGCHVHKNRAIESGAGFYFGQYCRATMSRSTVDHNYVEPDGVVVTLGYGAGAIQLPAQVVTQKKALNSFMVFTLSLAPVPPVCLLYRLVLPHRCDLHHVELRGLLQSW